MMNPNYFDDEQYFAPQLILYRKLMNSCCLY